MVHNPRHDRGHGSSPPQSERGIRGQSRGMQNALSLVVNRIVRRLLRVGVPVRIFGNPVVLLIGAVFPSMIVVLSLAADHLIDTIAINTKIDVEEFKKQEKKRIDILKVRLATEQELLEEEKKIATIRSQCDQAQGKPT